MVNCSFLEPVLMIGVAASIRDGSDTSKLASAWLGCWEPALQAKKRFGADHLLNRLPLDKLGTLSLSKRASRLLQKREEAEGRVSWRWFE